MSKPTSPRLPIPAATPLPKPLADLLQPGRIRNLDDVTDVTALMIKAFSEGDIHPARSKEIRQWTELLYTSVSAKNPTSETQVNLITQLIALDQPIVPTRSRVIEAELAEAPQLMGTGPNMLTDNVHNLGSLINTPEPETTSGRESILVEID
jgi:hypothetical protein